ncbi:aldo/keto reductase [Gulosibacter molinativorax]|uniref:Aldo/keto reductase n=1 Tax=Gulosibacter molinativorax TaxID=256821 RepID=A0ABT7CA86_9MICO|nr:aldo/keto reductase [Gulosibacter molinativorax]MDJ1372112.1 aldo/keto reductase [Gulosibacter molinativorax]QUY62343.1 2,5-diketo-D-gluconate reductase [Gulosibacter molinativorax]
MNDQIPSIELRDGRAIPQLGLGLYKVPNDETSDLVQQAIEIGYRHFDTASLYGNEVGLGEGLRASGLPREDAYVTTKVWQDCHGYDETLRAFDDSLERLGLEEVDLYLIHWPAPAQDRYVETWEALQRLHDEGRAHSIGVANFKEHHLTRLIEESGETPACNQVELHPSFAQPELRRFHAQHHIATVAWSPLARGADLDNTVLTDIAAAHECTPAQVVLAWHMKLGNVAIPKTVHPGRLRENLAAANIQLTAEECASILTLDTGARRGKDPDLFD